MTENDTGYAPPPPGFTPPPTPPAGPSPAPSRPGLRRTRGDAAVLGGVAAGIARSLRIDPVLVRVAFVVLAVFGGSGLLLYVAGWLFIPEEGRDDSVGERFFRDNNALVITLGVIAAILVLGPMVAWGWLGDGAGAGGVLLLVLVVVGVVLLLRRDDRSATPTDAPLVQAQAPTAEEPTTRPVGDDSPTSPTLALPHAPPPGPPSAPSGQPPVSPPPPPPPQKQRSVLGRLTLGITLLVVGTLIALDLADVVVVEPVVVLAAALAVVATGLLVGTLVGRARGLIALGIVLVFLLIPVGAAPNGLRVDGGAGERLYRPGSQAELADTYELGVGKMTVDLRRLELVGTEEVEASLGLGELIVLLPPDVAVEVDAEVGVGTVDFPSGGSEEGGIGLDRTWSRDGEGGTLQLDLSTGMGAVTVIDDEPLAGGRLVTQ